jgi:4-amino-4-deoxy-L-arabinose transferase-like glycosyltransferase
MVLARALRHFSYRDIYAPDAPPHVLYPPGYPAFLAGGTGLFGESFDAAAAVSVFCAMGALALTFLIVRRLWSAWGAVAVVALLAFNPFLVEVDGRPVSEPAFMLLSMAALYLALDPDRRGGLGAALAATGAALVRGVGLPLVAALGLYQLLRRRWRGAALVAGIAGITAVPWYAWSVLAPGQYVGASYSADFRRGDAVGRAASPALAHPPDQRPAGASSASLPVRAAGRIVRNARDYVLSETPRALGTPAIAGTPVDNVLFAGVVLIGLIAGLAVCWRRWNLGALYVGTFGALLLIWPWVSGRFLAPLLPVLATMLLLGVAVVARRRSPRAEGAAVAVVAALLLTGSALRLGPVLTKWSQCDRTASLPTDAACVGEPVAQFMSVVEYVRDSLPADALLFTSQPHLTYLYTGRRAVLREAAGAHATSGLMDFLRDAGVQYVILSAVHPLDPRVPPLIGPACSSLTVVRAFPPSAYLLRLLPAGAPPDEAACAAIAAQEQTSQYLR